MSTAALRRLTAAVLALGALATAGFLFHYLDRSQDGWWLPFLLFLGWNLLPFAVLAAGNAWMARTRARGVVLLVASAAVAAGAPALYYDAFIRHPDAQSALVTLFAPAYLLVLAVAALLLVGVLALRRPVPRGGEAG